MPDIDPLPASEHIFLIFNIFIRKMSNLGIHLYNMRKHVAWMQTQSHVMAICTAPVTMS